MLTKISGFAPDGSGDWKVGFGSSTTHENGGLVVGSGCVLGRFERPQPNSSLSTSTKD